MNKIITGTFAVGLLLGLAACSSDDTTANKTAATNAATTANDDTIASADTAVTDETAAPADTTASPAEQIPGLSAAQSQVVTMTLDAAAAVGVQIDEDCFIAAVGQLSEADAQLVIAAGTNGDPTLSPEGEALGTEAAKCVITDVGTTPTT